MKILPIVFLSLALAGAVACGNSHPKSPVAGLTKPVNPPEMPNLGRKPGTIEIDLPYNMYVTDSVRTTCAGPDPFFAFDASKPTVGDQPTMKNLVTCMTSGPLSSKSIKLIGHTDPRGSPGYNDKLGLERAEKVKTFLVANGIGAARVQTATMGADEASQAPKEWARDRRVEIQLVH